MFDEAIFWGTVSSSKGPAKRRLVRCSFEGRIVLNVEPITRRR